jgi:hypothetical protein
MDAEEINDSHRLAAHALLAAEESLCDGDRRSAIKCANTVLECEDVEAYHPAAKALIERASKSTGKPQVAATKEELEVCAS